MSQNVRQNNLFAAEDFTKIYQSFKNVDFKSYDYDTILESMIDNIKAYYPENFNDYIDSSEFIAHLQLLASVASSLAFRTDLNSRDNFLDTAERKDSVIRLARMLNYQPKRNNAASGLFKLVAVQTNESVKDSLGRLLQGNTIFWNDTNNSDSYDQFIAVMNSIFSNNNPFGKPYKSINSNGITTSLYQLNNVKNVEVSYPITVNVNNSQLPFEVVNADIDSNNAIVEHHPDPSNAFHILYRNDGQGLASPNTGFFFYVKQGKLSFDDKRFDFPVKNRLVDLDIEDVNENDVFVQKIDNDGNVIDKWTKVPNANAGSNVIYNALSLSQRNIFSVLSRVNDKITINYPDGNFGNVPTGIFRTWYRTSANQLFVVRPEEASNLEISILYIGKDNQQHVARFIFSLQESINNSSLSETVEQIKSRAPQVYYTQDRMVNTEDYNVFPLTLGGEILKVKTINRTHSGHSRYIDINDPTGFYQNIIVDSNDGALYRENYVPYLKINIENEISEEKSIIYHLESNLLNNTYLRSFFYDQYLESYLKFKTTNYVFGTSTYNRFNVFEFTNDSTNLPATHNGIYEFWTVPDTQNNNQGYFVNTSSAAVDTFTAIFNISIPKKNPTSPIGTGELEYGKFKFLSTGCKVKFINPDNSLEYISATVKGLDQTDLGTLVTFDVNVGKKWIITEIYPTFRIDLNDLEFTAIESQLKNRNNFSLSYNIESGQWGMSNIYSENSEYDFSVEPAKWIMYAKYNAKEKNYEFITRGIRYIFESYKDVRFYFDENQTFYDSQTLSYKKDIITLTPNNKKPTTSEIWIVNDNNEWVKNDDKNIKYPLNYILLESRRYTNENITIVNHSNSSFSFNINNGLLNISGAVPNEGDAIEIKYLEPNSYLDSAISWNLLRAVYLEDGYLDSKRIEIVPIDSDHDGIPDNILEFKKVVSNDGLVFFEDYTNFDGYTLQRLAYNKWIDARGSNGQFIFSLNDLYTNDFILIVENDYITSTFARYIETLVFDAYRTSTDPYSLLQELSIRLNLYLFIQRVSTDGDVIVEQTSSLPIFLKLVFNAENSTKILEEILSNPTNITYSNILTLELQSFDYVYDQTHTVRNGRSFTLDANSTEKQPLFYVWKHYAPIDNRIDPSISNIMDMTLLTTSYYLDIIKWKNKQLPLNNMPVPASSESLKVQYGDLNKYKMASDQIIFNPAKFKLLFGTRSKKELQAKFKVVKLPGTTITDNEIKSRVISAIDDYFDIGNWDFGESFYYTELAAYIHKKLANVVASVVLVPDNKNSQFGNLFQIKCEPNELFLSTATVNDVEIVTNLTDSNLRV